MYGPTEGRTNPLMPKRILKLIVPHKNQGETKIALRKRYKTNILQEQRAQIHDRRDGRSMHAHVFAAIEHQCGGSARWQWPPGQ